MVSGHIYSYSDNTAQLKKYIVYRLNIEDTVLDQTKISHNVRDIDIIIKAFMVPASVEQIITKKGHMITFLYSHKIADTGRIF